MSLKGQELEWKGVKWQSKGVKQMKSKNILRVRREEVWEMESWKDKWMWNVECGMWNVECGNGKWKWRRGNGKVVEMKDDEIEKGYKV
jgi:hypothetical protein